jgi:hypothetical protein
MAIFSRKRLVKAFIDKAYGWLVGAIVLLVTTLIGLLWLALNDPNHSRGFYVFIGGVGVAITMTILAVVLVGIELQRKVPQHEKTIANLEGKVAGLLHGEQTLGLQLSARTTELDRTGQVIGRLERDNEDLRKTLSGFAVPVGTFRMKSARYGAVDVDGRTHQIDVLEFLEDRFIEDGKLRLPRKRYRKYFPDDPLPGKPKWLEIEYTHGGRKFLVTVPENTVLTLPFPYDELLEE